MRCTFCRGYLPFSYITYDGITVYRCSGEDSFNDKGRFFIASVAGAIEVLPKRKSGREWTFEILDTERRRLEIDANRVSAEIEERRKVFLKSQREYANFKRDEDDDDEVSQATN